MKLSQSTLQSLTWQINRKPCLQMVENGCEDPLMYDPQPQMCASSALISHPRTPDRSHVSDRLDGLNV